MSFFVAVIGSWRHMNRFDHGISDILVTAEQIQTRIGQLGQQLSEDYADREQALLVVVLLKGAFVFAADLIRAIELPLETEFMIASSYGDNTESSREVRIVKDIDAAIQGRDVLIIDDIIDTGHTFHEIVALLATRQPASLKTCALLDKAERREVDLDVDYVGFKIPDQFVVGYGLDYAQSFRGLPYIGVFDPKV
jgi:hypoxanthine phosphoribosyltransferase